MQVIRQSLAIGLLHYNFYMGKYVEREKFSVELEKTLDFAIIMVSFSTKGGG